MVVPKHTVKLVSVMTKTNNDSLQLVQPSRSARCNSTKMKIKKKLHRMETILIDSLMLIDKTCQWNVYCAYAATAHKSWFICCSWTYFIAIEIRDLRRTLLSIIYFVSKKVGWSFMSVERIYLNLLDFFFQYFLHVCLAFVLRKIHFKE